MKIDFFILPLVWLWRYLQLVAVVMMVKMKM